MSARQITECLKSLAKRAQDTADQQAFGERRRLREACASIARVDGDKELAAAIQFSGDYGGWEWTQFYKHKRESHAQAIIDCEKRAEIERAERLALKVMRGDLIEQFRALLDQGLVYTPPADVPHLEAHIEELVAKERADEREKCAVLLAATGHEEAAAALRAIGTNDKESGHA